MALSQYGNFSNLKQIVTSENNIPTYSFSGSSYVSDKIVFEPHEIYDNSQRQVETLVGEAKTVFSSYGTGSIPFLCIDQFLPFPEKFSFHSKFILLELKSLVFFFMDVGQSLPLHVIRQQNFLCL